MSAQRSYIMSRIRSKNTKPERRLAGALGARGHRFTKHANLPGKPDIVLQPNVAVFVDGCFFHGCPYHWSMPKTNVDFWAEKFKRNKERDRAADMALEAMGWHVIRLWEHDVKDDLDYCVERICQGISRKAG